MKGVIGGGTMTAGTVLFILPAGYRPAAQRAFPAVQGGNATARLEVRANGDVVTTAGLTNNALLTLEGVRFGP